MLDFANSGRLNPRVTFTRASTATYFDATGTLQSAANDVPRFDYNPATLAAQGFLIEESRTNLLTYSEAFDNASWTKVNLNTTGTPPWVNVEVAPDGATTADKIIEDTNTGTHSAGQVNVFTSGTTYSASIYAKAAERTRVRFGGANTATFAADAIFDLSSGSVFSTSFGTASIFPVGNGWYRLTVTGVAGATAGTNIIAYLISTGTTTNYTGDGTSGLYVWGAQLEAGAFPTSYIPTTTTALTRAADVASVNTLSPWYNATESTLYMEYVWEGLKSISGQPVVAIDNGSISERIAFLATSANAMQNVTNVAGVTSGSNVTPATTYVANTLYKVAAGVKLDDMQSALNGVSGSTDNTTLLPTGLTTLRFGATTGSAISNFWIRRFAYYPRRLSQAELAAITA
jgi:hypothetical protein